MRRDKYTLFQMSTSVDGGGGSGSGTRKVFAGAVVAANVALGGTITYAYLDKDFR